MHLLVCALGTLLAMVGHVPHRPRLWVPHVVGLAAMLALAYGVGGEPLRWSGVALLVLLALLGTRVGALRTRVESGIDAAAMVVLVAVLPAMGHHGPQMSGMSGMSGTGHGSLLVALVTVAGWAGARGWAAHRFSGAGCGLARLDLAGASLMVAGMTLMVAS